MFSTLTRVLFNQTRYEAKELELEESSI